MQKRRVGLSLVFPTGMIGIKYDTPYIILPFFDVRYELHQKTLEMLERRLSMGGVGVLKWARSLWIVCRACRSLCTRSWNSMKCEGYPYCMLDLSAKSKWNLLCLMMHVSREVRWNSKLCRTCMNFLVLFNMCMRKTQLRSVSEICHHTVIFVALQMKNQGLWGSGWANQELVCSASLCLSPRYGGWLSWLDFLYCM